MKSKPIMLLLSLLISSSGLGGCTPAEEIKDPELKQTLAYVRYLTSHRFRRQSAFSYSYPDQRPSEFVRYLFSTIGSAEWVVTGDPDEAEQLKSIRVPVPASNVAITNQWLPEAERQLVLKGNDQNNEIIVEAYMKDRKIPIFTEEISFQP